MFETIFALLFSFLLSRHSSASFYLFFQSFFGQADHLLLNLAAYGTSILLFLLLALILRFIFRKAMPVIRSLDLGTIWNSFRHGICLRTLLQLVAGVLCSAFAGLLLLMAAYCLPTAPIQNHIREYIPYPGGSYQGTYPSLSVLCTSQLDGFTDSIILLESGDDTQDTVLHKALLNYHSTIDTSDDIVSVLNAHYRSGVPFTGSDTYSRYWHGYLIFTKPLLSLLNFRQIRILNGIVQFLLALWICWLLDKRDRRSYIPVWLMIYLMLMPAALAMSLQFSPCYYLAVIGTIVLLQMGRNRAAQSGYLVFLFTGIGLAYFDFLTYPVATFGIPAAFFVLLFQDDSAETVLGKLIQNGLSWLWGYAGMWISKWLLGTLFTGKNVIQDAMGKIQFRASSTASVGAGGEIVHSLAESIWSNLVSFLYTPFTLLLLALVIYTIYKVHQTGFSPLAGKRDQLLLYSAIGAIPLLWYAVVANHSLVHYWFTNKSASVLFLCIGFACTLILDQIRQRSAAQTDI